VSVDRFYRRRTAGGTHGIHRCLSGGEAGRVGYTWKQFGVLYRLLAEQARYGLVDQAGRRHRSDSATEMTVLQSAAASPSSSSKSITHPYLLAPGLNDEERRFNLPAPRFPVQFANRSRRPQTPDSHRTSIHRIA